MNTLIRPELKQWVVSVISTDFDLHDIRIELNDFLEKKGFEIQSFEESNFVVEPGVYSHEACKLAIQYIDIAILILDKRYGGKYLGEDKKSITHLEYETAINLDKILIPCVRDKLEQERFELNTRAKKEIKNNNSDNLLEVMSKYRTAYAKEIELILFLEQVRKADKDNFIIYFDSPKDLKERIVGRLEGLTRYLCQKIIEKQVDNIKRLKNPIIFQSSIGDIIDNEIYIEPEIEIISGKTKNTSKLLTSDLINPDQNNKKNILVMGSPGIGKTTFLSKIFLSQAIIDLQTKSNKLPFYINLRGLSSHYCFNLKEFLNDQLALLYGKDKYPLLKSSLISPYLYIDGLDELQENLDDEHLEKFIGTNLFKYPFLLASRTSFINRFTNHINFYSLFDLIIELKDWKIEKSIELSKRICKLNNSDKSFEYFKNYIESGKGKFLTNPLLTLMFIYIIIESPRTTSFIIKDISHLFEIFIKLITKREIKRATKPNSLVKFLIETWKQAAWTIYEHRASLKDLYLDNLIERIKNTIPEGEEIIDNNAFRSIIDIGPYSKVVKGMIHEQFMEYLVAELFVDSCIENKKIIEDYLYYNFKYSVNIFIKGILSREKKENLKNILESLNEVLKRNININSDRSLPISINSIYYLSILPNSKLVLESLKNISKLKRLKVSIKHAVLFSLVRLGDIDSEELLYSELNRNKEMDNINRGVHLIYFEDWITSKPNPHFDNNNINWEKTFTGLLQHIFSLERRYVYSKRIDLKTIHSFILSRPKNKILTVEAVDKIKSAIDKNIKKWLKYRSLLNNARKELTKIEVTLKKH